MQRYVQQSYPPVPAQASSLSARPANAGIEQRSAPCVAAAHPGADLSRIPTRSPAPQGGILYRHATGTGPGLAPPLVHEVLRGQGSPLPIDVRRDAEARLGHDFADVRVHTDARAAASAQAVAAHAYTVGRQIVFAPGHFAPSSAQGRRLLTHELSHAAAHRPGTPTPSGALRISSPSDAAERHAAGVADGRIAPGIPAPQACAALAREDAPPIVLAGVGVNHDRVTVPPAAGLALAASATPADATAVTFTLAADSATLARGTSIDSATGAITVASTQTGGSAVVHAAQTVTLPNGAPRTTTHGATVNFCAVPGAISRTVATRAGVSGAYGGQFVHTFRSPRGGQSALEGSHVNERFAAASGTTLTLEGTLGTLDITINDPDLATDGWDLDATGTMTGPDDVTWSDTLDARPFVANASHRRPRPALPQAFSATQSMRNLTYPAETYRTTAVASTRHRRAFEERDNRIKAVTSANAAGINQEIVEDYTGPTIFRRARAAPTSIPVAAPAVEGGAAPTPATTTISVDAEGQSATPEFTVLAPELDCTISDTGVLTPGATPGRVTVRAGDVDNYDETTVTLTALPAAPTPAVSAP